MRTAVFDDEVDEEGGDDEGDDARGYRGYEQTNAPGDASGDMATTVRCARRLASAVDSAENARKPQPLKRDPNCGASTDLAHRRPVSVSHDNAEAAGTATVADTGTGGLNEATTRFHVQRARARARAFTTRQERASALLRSCFIAERFRRDLKESGESVRMPDFLARQSPSDGDRRSRVARSSRRQAQPPLHKKGTAPPSSKRVHSHRAVRRAGVAAKIDSNPGQGDERSTIHAKEAVTTRKYTHTHGIGLAQAAKVAHKAVSSTLTPSNLSPDRLQKAKAFDPARDRNKTAIQKFDEAAAYVEMLRAQGKARESALQIPLSRALQAPATARSKFRGMRASGKLSVRV